MSKKKKKRLWNWKHLVVNSVYLHFQSSMLKVTSFGCRQTKNSFQLPCTAKLSSPTAAWIRGSLKSFELCCKSEESLAKVLDDYDDSLSQCSKVLHDFTPVPLSFTLCVILSLRSALPLWFVRNLDRCAVDEVQVQRGRFGKTRCHRWLTCKQNSGMWPWSLRLRGISTDRFILN